MRVKWVLPPHSNDFNNVMASLWIRCLQLLPYFQELGVETRVNDPEFEADIVIFQRVQGDEFAKQMVEERSRGAHLVFDLCVNCLDRSEVPGRGVVFDQEYRRQCLDMVENADAVSCASRNITEVLCEYHSNVHCLPDSVDDRHF
jgi:hypothetical protein